MLPWILHRLHLCVLATGNTFALTGIHKRNWGRGGDLSSTLQPKQVCIFVLAALRDAVARGTLLDKSLLALLHTETSSRAQHASKVLQLAAGFPNSCHDICLPLDIDFYVHLITKYISNLSH